MGTYNVIAEDVSQYGDVERLQYDDATDDDLGEWSKYDDAIEIGILAVVYIVVATLVVWGIVAAIRWLL